MTPTELPAEGKVLTCSEECVNRMKKCGNENSDKKSNKKT
jgi:hypothetical protein